jgi:hypothetical protein
MNRFCEMRPAPGSTGVTQPQQLRFWETTQP